MSCCFGSNLLSSSNSLSFRQRHAEVVDATLTRRWVRRSGTPSTTMTTTQHGRQPRPDSPRCGLPAVATAGQLSTSSRSPHERRTHPLLVRSLVRDRSDSHLPSGTNPVSGKLGTADVEVGGGRWRTTRRGRASQCGSNSTGLPRGDSTIRIIYPIDRGRDHVGWWPLTPFQVPQVRQIRRSLTRDDITHARGSYRR